MRVLETAQNIHDMNFYIYDCKSRKPCTERSLSSTTGKKNHTFLKALPFQQHARTHARKHQDQYRIAYGTTTNCPSKNAQPQCKTNGGISSHTRFFQKKLKMLCLVVRSSSYRSGGAPSCALQFLRCVESFPFMFGLFDLGSDCLGFHLVGLADDFVGGSLDDAAGSGELGADAHEVGVDVASCLAAFVDAPERY